MAAQRWFVEVDGVEQGPLAAGELRTWAGDGRVTWGTRLRLEGREKPLRARDIPGLLPPEPTAPPAFDPSAPASDLFEQHDASAGPPPRIEPEAFAEAGRSADFDPAAKPEELFENYTPPSAFGTTGVRRAAQVQARPLPSPLPHRETVTRDEERAQAYLATVEPVGARPIGACLVDAPLDQPQWQRLWPLASLCLVLGWFIGGFFSFERMYGGQDGLPVFLLALGGVPLPCAAMLYYLRPRQVPVGTAIGVALFTAIAGIFLLLMLQALAAVAAHSTRGYVGRGGAVFAIFAMIGTLYDLTNSANIALRWVGFVLGVGLMEEMTKLLPLVMLVVWRSDRHLSVHAFLFAGFASGIGFGIGEAFYCYAPWNGNHGLDANIIRWYSAVPSHAIYTTVCAAFLWKMADHVEHADGFWERALVVAMAAGLMAVVHGTYNTVCSIGIIPALVMEILSFALLAWVVTWISRDATEPRGSTPTPWLARLMPSRIQAMGLGLAAIMLVGAGLMSSSREDVMPDLIRSALPESVRPYVDGVTVDRDRDGEPFAVPLTVRFVFDPDEGIVAILRNQGEAAFTALSAECRDTGSDREIFDLGTLAGGAEIRIDSDRGWSFAPGESLTITVDDRHIIRLRLP
jgi:RsiW-degrading membrane proteinase PrsW (M82 family)